MPAALWDIVDNFSKNAEFYMSNAEEYRAQMQRIHSVCGLMLQFHDQEQTEEENLQLFPEFHLPEQDEDRFFGLCSEIRKIVLASAVFDEPHKRRLLNRVAAMEYEAKQKNGKLDVILAGVVDVGDALGKFGTSIEPLTKRVKELAQIARSNSKEYNQIPSPDETKALPPPENKDSQYGE